MHKRRLRLEQDGVFILFSIALAIFLIQSDLIQSFLNSLQGLQVLAIFFAGMFFTSIFTTAPSMAMISVLAQDNNIFLVAFIGGLGAMLGDYIIFKFIKDRISEDFKYIFDFPKRKRIPHIFRTKIFHWFVPFFGALIMASPIPNEIGITILSLSNTNNKFFLTVSYIFNSIGIFLVAVLSKTLV
jgi:hypothetical protein